MPSILDLMAPIAARFMAAIEAEIADRTRALIADWIRQGKMRAGRAAGLAGRRTRAGANRRADILEPTLTARLPAAAEAVSGVFANAAPRSRAKPRTRRPSAPRVEQPIDRAAAERTAELNRLRAILRPTHDAIASDDTAAEPQPETSAVATVGSADTAYQDPIRALEDEIRDGMAFLSTLPPARVAAQIAAWAGSARLHQEEQGDPRTRIAAGLLLEKLRGLQRAMEVDRIDALAPTFVADDWRRYVSAKQAEAAGTAAAPADAEQQPAAADDYDGVWSG